nr:296_t:CDS:2 [Entrophospora candida]
MLRNLQTESLSQQPQQTAQFQHASLLNNTTTNNTSNGFNTQQNPEILQQPAGIFTQNRLVPEGSAYSRQTYEPTHKCTTCGHIHDCQNCKNRSLLQQAIEPHQVKYFEPIIQNTAKALSRRIRRTEHDPYFRRNSTKRIGISQDEILERSRRNPNLSISQIVEEINKENEAAHEKDWFQSLSPVGTYNTSSQFPAHFTSADTTSLQNQGVIQQTQTTDSTMQNTSFFGQQSRTFQNPIISREPVSFGRSLVNNTQISQNVPMLNLDGTNLRPSLSNLGLNFRKIKVKHVFPKKSASIVRPLPNPVPPNIRTTSGAYEEMKKFFNKVWGWNA